VVAHRRQQAGESLDVVARKRLEQQAADHLDMPWQHFRQQLTPGIGEGDGDAPFVVG